MEAEQQLVTPGSLDLRWQDPEQPERDRDRFHVAINMDGNGRWALIRGRPREEGHVAGASAVRRTVESAPALGITTLTLYAFSSDNWRRPQGEVDNLMLLLQQVHGHRVRPPERPWCALQRNRASGPDRGFPQTQHRGGRGAYERRDLSPPSGCDRLFGPRCAGSGRRPCRQRADLHPSGLRAMPV